MIRLAVRWLAVCAVVGLLLTAVGWYVLGGRIYSVQSDSMRPVFKRGDAVLTTKPATNLAVGSIVSFRDRSDPRVIMTHRVQQSSGDTLLTKGDNNPQPDLPIQTDSVVAHAWLVAPGLGRVINWLRTPLGLILAVYVPAAIALLAICLSFIAGWNRVTYKLR